MVPFFQNWSVGTLVLYFSGPVKPVLPWVPETFLARFPVSVKSYALPHARETSGTQGKPV